MAGFAQQRQGANGPARVRRGASVRVVRTWALVSGLCLVFSVIYAQFSHGVASPFMTWLFAIPALGGVVEVVACTVAQPDRFALNAYRSGVAALAVSSCLRGIFEIAGTASPYVNWYVAAGIALVALAVARTIMCHLRAIYA